MRKTVNTKKITPKQEKKLDALDAQIKQTKELIDQIEAINDIIVKLNTHLEMLGNSAFKSNNPGRAQIEQEELVEEAITSLQDALKLYEDQELGVLMEDVRSTLGHKKRETAQRIQDLFDRSTL